MVHDWTIDTPIGRFGFAELGFTPDMTQAWERLRTQKLLNLGSCAVETGISATSVGSLGVLAGVLDVGLFGAVGYLIVRYVRGHSHHESD